MKHNEATCDCCNRRWKAQMQQAGITFHLCGSHADELVNTRGKDKNQKQADTLAEKWAKTMKKYEAPPIISVPA